MTRAGRRRALAGTLDITAPDGWHDDQRPLLVVLTHCGERSGAELFVARVTEALVAHRPLVVLGAHGPLEGLLVERGVAVAVLPLATVVADHGADSRSTPIRAAQQALALVRHVHALAEVLRTLRPAVVWTHSAKAHVYGGLAARRAHVPVVAHVHDLVRRAGASRAGVLLLSVALRVLPQGLIANSATTLASIGATGRVRTSVIGCPVVVPGGSRMRASAATATSAPASASAGAAGAGRPSSEQRQRGAAQSLTIGLVGRITAWKGQDVALRAFAVARARHDIGPDSRMRIVGGALFAADRDHERSLRALAATLGIADAVEFTGHLDDHADAVADCAVMLHTSTRPEPFGQVVVEAMAAGRAVIATDAGGPAEIVTHREDGLLVTPGDVGALADALTLLAVDPELRERLAEAAVVSAQRFERGRIVAELEAFLQSVVR